MLLTFWSMKRLGRANLLGLVAAFTRRNMPLEESLLDLAKIGTGTKEAESAGRLAASLDSGEPLHIALQRQNAIDAQQAAALQLAEKRGATAGLLTQFAAHATPNAERMLKYDTMLLYSIIVGLPLLFTSSFINIFIIPKFKQMILEMEIHTSEMPFIVVAFSPYFVLALIAWGLILFTFKLKWCRPLWRRVPFLGTPIRMEEQARLSRWLGLALSAGVTLEEGLCAMAEATGGLKQSLSKVQKAIENGEPPSRAFRQCGRWRDEFLWALDAIAAGANAAGTFNQVAEVLEEKVQARLNTIYRIGTQVGVLIAAIGVGTMAWAVFSTLTEISWSFMR